MKSLNWILGITLLLVSIGYVFQLMKPTPEVKVKYVHGDTVKTIINKEVLDSLTYIFEAQIDSIKKTKVKYVVGKTKTDTINTTDTLYLSYWSRFRLGTDTLGVKGKVSFNMKDFTFDEIVFNNQEVIKTVVDTMMFTEIYTKPFLLDPWFYTTFALIIAMIGVAL